MSLLDASIDYLNDFISLLFPNLCQACEQSLAKGEETLCIFCQYELPQTEFHKEKDNPVAKLFWGRVEIENASSLYFFHKKTKVQHLFHKLKYHGKKEIGYAVGKIYGMQLKEYEPYQSVSKIIPVPLHPAKVRKRGYNQSDYFAMGLAESMETEWSDKILIRTLNNPTQTGKTRFERWNNVKEVFQLKKPEAIANSHVLLVDDVITTGATLEACAKKLLEGENVKVSIVTMAVAHH